MTARIPTADTWSVTAATTASIAALIGVCQTTALPFVPRSETCRNIWSDVIDGQAEEMTQQSQTEAKYCLPNDLDARNDWQLPAIAAGSDARYVDHPCQ